MDSVRQQFDGRLRGCDDIIEIVERQRETLQKEVKKYCEGRQAEIA